ncbi:hypothetical protein [Agrobacterium vitis]|uniref:hypothetical protein n=1 Tax=Agrobacterium vitis TaxID=373 RepID=UPI00087223E7|nr:hypothetical protein [Agrobacterium vitis]MCE6073263.1 hypothetical protein [Agrobacterium vitis]MCM2451338.1 hypothetical protein [Agrobacterium vitis]MCM2469259.1 hypothetical protein [Agrobacterium vitis]MUO69338.1 hypothetical protein [Agrobacterium vitis]MUO83818.1 hypothetical protein [Agrobacterium vitis]
MSINHEDRKDQRLLFFRDKPCQVLLLIETEQGASPDVPDALIFVGTDPAAAYASWRQKNPSSALPVLFNLSAGLDHDDFAALLARLMALKPDGLVLTDAATAADSQRLDALLRVEEAKAGLADGSTPFIALLGGNPSGFFQASAIAASSARLIGLGLDEGAVVTAIQAETPHHAQPVLETCRSLVQLAAASANLPAIIQPFSSENADAAADLVKRGFGALIGNSGKAVEMIRAALPQTSGL